MNSDAHLRLVSVDFDLPHSQLKLKRADGHPTCLGALGLWRFHHSFEPTGSGSLRILSMSAVDCKEYFPQSVLKSALSVALNEFPHSVDVLVGEAQRSTIYKSRLEASQNALESAGTFNGPAQHLLHPTADHDHYLLVGLR